MQLPLKTCAAVVTAALFGLAACGDDDDNDARPAADQTDAEAEPAAAGDDSSGDAEEYCAAVLALETAPPPDVDFESASPEEIAEAIKAYSSDVMRPLADDVVAAAPDEVAEEVAVLDAAVDEVAATGEDAFSRPDVAAAEEAVHDFDLDTCGWDTVDVTASNYAFDGLPAELPAGTTSFELTNDAAEVHELLLVRKNDGVTLTAEELLAMPQEEALTHVAMLGDPAFALPGGADHKVVDLEPGDYVALCFIPMGMTSPDGPPPAGPPHAMQGMHAEFTVTG